MLTRESGEKVDVSNYLSPKHQENTAFQVDLDEDDNLVFQLINPENYSGSHFSCACQGNSNLKEKILAWI